MKLRFAAVFCALIGMGLAPSPSSAQFKPQDAVSKAKKAKKAEKKDGKEGKAKGVRSMFKKGKGQAEGQAKK